MSRREQATYVDEARRDVNACFKSQLKDLFELVYEDDREGLIEFIDAELAMTRKLAPAFNKYVDELERMRRIIKEGEMNDKVKAQAINVYEKNLEMVNGISGHWDPERILRLIIDEDREILIPYIDDGIKMARNLGAKANDYIHELEHLKAILGGES